MPHESMKAVLFDLNGTLVDSENAHWMAYQEVLAEHDVEFSLAEFSEDWTRHGHDLLYTLKKHRRDDLLEIAQELKRKKDKIFRSTLTERITLMPGAETAIARLAGLFSLAVDSTSSREDVLRLLRHFGLDGMFKALSSADMPWDGSRYGKNTKATRFRWLADALSCSPEQCVVVGDAEKDVVAAKEAGMAVILVPAGATRDDDLSVPDRKLTSLIELDAAIVLEVLSSKDEDGHR